MKKIIVAQLNIKKGHEINFLELSKSMVIQSNNEIGCITYRLHQDIYNKGKYLFYEEYIDETARDFHNKSNHFKCFIDNVTPMLSEKPIIHNY